MHRHHLQFFIVNNHWVDLDIPSLTSQTKTCLSAEYCRYLVIMVGQSFIVSWPLEEPSGHFLAHSHVILETGKWKNTQRHHLQILTVKNHGQA